MIVVVITNCVKESTSGKPVSLVDSLKAAELIARNNNGNRSDGTTEVGCLIVFIIERRLRAA
jgi:hypothetical protein